MGVVSRFKIALILFSFTYSTMSGANAFRRLNQEDCNLNNKGSGGQLIEVANKVNARDIKTVTCEQGDSLSAEWGAIVRENQKRLARIYCSNDGSELKVFDQSLKGKKKRQALQQFREKYLRSSGMLFENSGQILTTRHAISLNAENRKIIIKPKACLVEDSLGNFHKIQASNFTNPKDTFGMMSFSDQSVLELKDPFPSEIAPIQVAEASVAVGEKVLRLSEVKPDGTIKCLASEVSVVAVRPPLGDSNGEFNVSGLSAPGQSGGPYFNARGELVGINVGTSGDTSQTAPVAFMPGQATTQWKYVLDMHLNAE
jgi:hypothetical protein